MKRWKRLNLLISPRVKCTMDSVWSIKMINSNCYFCNSTPLLIVLTLDPTLLPLCLQVSFFFSM